MPPGSRSAQQHMAGPAEATGAATAAAMRSVRVARAAALRRLIRDTGVILPV